MSWPCTGVETQPIISHWSCRRVSALVVVVIRTKDHHVESSHMQTLLEIAQLRKRSRRVNAGRNKRASDVAPRGSVPCQELRIASPLSPTAFPLTPPGFRSPELEVSFSFPLILPFSSLSSLLAAQDLAGELRIPPIAPLHCLTCPSVPRLLYSPRHG